MNIFNRQGPVISFLIMDTLSEIIAKDPETSVADSILKAYKSATNTVLSESDILAVATRLQKKESKPAGADDEAPAKRGPSLGTKEMGWVSSLKPEQLCLFIADYDYGKAKELYCAVDFEVVVEMGDLKQTDRYNRITSAFEAAMYGFGGSYKGDKPTDKDANAIDVDATKEGGVSDASLAAIKKMGF